MSQIRPDQAAAVSAEAPPPLRMMRTTPTCLWDDSATSAELRVDGGSGTVEILQRAPQSAGGPPLD